MDTKIAEPAETAPSETEAERLDRLARETEGIAKARASIAAGYYATSAEVNAWIDSLGSDTQLQVPYPLHPRSRRPNPAFYGYPVN